MLNFRTLGVAAGFLAAALTSSFANELRIVGTGDGMEQLRALGSAYTADNPDTLIIVSP